jgi:hypothetical protein
MEEQLTGGPADPEAPAGPAARTVAEQPQARLSGAAHIQHGGKGAFTDVWLQASHI